MYAVTKKATRDFDAVCPVLRKVDSYFCYYLVICFFMLYATFDACTCSGVSKFKAQCGRLLL